MSPAELPLGRPKLLRRQSTSASLLNMEIPFTPRAAKSFEIHQDQHYEPGKVNKPLPPTPKAAPSTPQTVPRTPQTGPSSPKISLMSPRISPPTRRVPQLPPNALPPTHRAQVMTPVAAPATARKTPSTPKSATITRRRTSSVYSTQGDTKAGSQNHSGIGSSLMPSVSLDPITCRSSTSKLPDPGPTRPSLTREAKTQAACATMSQQTQEPQKNPTLSSLAPNRQWQLSIDPQPKTRSQTSTISNRILQGTESAEQLAEDYKTVLHTTPQALAGAAANPYYDQEISSVDMSHRITDVTDQSLMPQPRYSSDSSSVDGSERPRSRFSSSSDSGSPHNSFRNPFKAAARKAFHLRTESADSDGTEWAAFTQFQKKTSMPSRRQSRAESLIGQRRSSLQQGISSMYDTLANLSAFSVKPTLADVKSPAESNGSRLRNPAIPLTAYQQMGTKAWETKPKSSRRAAKSVGASQVPVPLQENRTQVRFTAPAYKSQPLAREPKARSMVGKIASAFQSGSVQVESAVGFNTDRVKRTKSQKRREDLKRKIKVIGLGDPGVDGTTGNWL